MLHEAPQEVLARCLTLCCHSVTFGGGELLVRGAKHGRRSLQEPILLRLKQDIRFGGAGGGRLCGATAHSGMSHVNICFITLSTRATATSQVI